MQDLSNYKINVLGPLGRNIKEIIVQKSNVIIYMDSEDIIQWFTVDMPYKNEYFGEIQNKISYWESITNNLFSKKHAYDLKCVLAEAYARILDNNDIVTARDIIERCRIRIEKHGSEILKQNYVFSSLTFTFLCFLLVFLIRSFKTNLIEHFSLNVYEIFMTMLFGGIGSFVFAIGRLKSYKPDIVISKKIHILDGMLRVLYGIIAGLIVAIAIKSNFVFGFLNSIDKSIYVSVLLGVVAGSSEVFIPNLIKQIDGKAIENNN